MIKVGINGLGRIGRAAFKVLADMPDVELAAVNDLAPAGNLAYLLQHDSVYGRYEREVKADKENIIVDGKKCRVFSEKDPSKLPWRDMQIDLVFECTGRFATKDLLSLHLNAGARNAVLSAPSKNKDIETVVFGVNHARAGAHIISTASCTTNCIAPVIEIVGRRVGIRKAVMSTVHAYTSSQSLVDSPNKRFLRGRAAAVNIVPSSTGAATATTQVLPQYRNKFDGSALRVPVPAGSISEITMVTERPVTVDELNGIFREEAAGERYKEVVSVSEYPAASSDIIKDPHASIVDLTVTKVVDGDLAVVSAWYDNEWGYAHQMVRAGVEMATRAAAATAGR